MNKLLGGSAALAVWLLMLALWALRWVAFGLLLFIRPLAVGAAGWLGALALVALVIGLMVAPAAHLMLWCLLGTGVACVLLAYFFEVLLLLLAPAAIPLMLSH